MEGWLILAGLGVVAVTIEKIVRAVRDLNAELGMIREALAPMGARASNRLLEEERIEGVAREARRG